MRRAASGAQAQAQAQAPEGGPAPRTPLGLVRRKRAAAEAYGSAPRCSVDLKGGESVKGMDEVDILAWQRHAGHITFEVRACPSQTRGRIVQSSPGSDDWAIVLADATSASNIIPLLPGAIDGLLTWAADALLDPARLEADPRLNGIPASTFGGARGEPFLKGDGVVCFDAVEFLTCLRTSPLAVPVMFPHGALRLELWPLLRLMVAAQRTLAESNLVAEIVNARPDAGETLLPLLQTGRCRLQHDGEHVYFKESPLKCSSWLLGEVAQQCPDLFEAISSSPYADGPGLPFLWMEEDSKFFVGDAGTSTRSHRDILWLPQLGLVLAGSKRLAISQWPQGVGEEACGASLGDSKVLSVVSQQAGDLIAFNASALHRATNVGETPTAALYQGFLPLPAVPHFCAAPAEPPVPPVPLQAGEPPNSLPKHDATLEILRPVREGYGAPLIDRVAWMQEHIGPECSEEEAQLLQSAFEALGAAETRLSSTPL